MIFKDFFKIFMLEILILFSLLPIIKKYCNNNIYIRSFKDSRKIHLMSNFKLYTNRVEILKNSAFIFLRKHWNYLIESLKDVTAKLKNNVTKGENCLFAFSFTLITWLLVFLGKILSGSVYLYFKKQIR